MRPDLRPHHKRQIRGCLFRPCSPLRPRRSISQLETADFEMSRWHLPIAKLQRVTCYRDDKAERLNISRKNMDGDEVKNGKKLVMSGQDVFQVRKRTW